MEFKEIISVPGMGGLYKVVANNRAGFIVESLVDSKRTVINSNQRIMTLVDIAVYTADGEVPLREIYKKIQSAEGNKLKVDVKGDQTKLREYFKKLIPDFDEERVYTSDIKKMLTWFELLSNKIDFSKVEEKEGHEKSVVGEKDGKTPVKAHHEAHGPKVESAKKATARTRKKV